jgi:hypothetical protein
MLESSEARRNRRVDALLKDKAVSAAVHRDQRPKPKTGQDTPKPKRAAGV